MLLCFFLYTNTCVCVCVYTHLCTIYCNNKNVVYYQTDIREIRGMGCVRFFLAKNTYMYNKIYALSASFFVQLLYLEHHLCIYAANMYITMFVMVLSIIFRYNIVMRYSAIANITCIDAHHTIFNEYKIK